MSQAGNQLAKVEDISPATWGILKEQCSVLVKSGFLPNSINTPEKAMAIALKGRELGIAPMHAFAHINIIQGKPAISSELMLALILRNIPGAKVDFERYEADSCHIRAARPGQKSVLFKFENVDAKAADLLGKDNWKKYPKAMYRSRCISDMARTIFPDAIMGCSYTPEELGANINEDGEVINIIPTPMQNAPHFPVMETQYTEPELSTSEPKTENRKGYDGSTVHREALEKTLKTRNIDESLWEDIHQKMIGKVFNDLAVVIKIVSN